MAIFRPTHSHDRALQEDVLLAGQIRVKARRHLDHSADAPPKLRHEPLRRVVEDAIQELESVVDLPALFGPMIPIASPRRTSNETSLQRPEFRSA